MSADRWLVLVVLAVVFVAVFAVMLSMYRGMLAITWAMRANRMLFEHFERTHRFGIKTPIEEVRAAYDRLQRTIASDSIARDWSCWSFERAYPWVVILVHGDEPERVLLK